jgi:hypothetical protein
VSYASKAGRARADPSNPQAQAVCDRCGIWTRFNRLQWQFQWRGPLRQNTRVLVCEYCLDVPNEQRRSIAVPADPTPVMNARVQDYAEAETDFQTITAPTVYDPTTGIPIPSTTTLLTEDGQNLTTQPFGPGPFGRHVGLEQDAVMPLNDDVIYAVKLPILSVIANGTDVVSVTCYEPHNLVTNAQISIEGLNVKSANGFYSVTVTTATAFFYQTNTAIPAGSLLQSVTVING